MFDKLSFLEEGWRWDISWLFRREKKLQEFPWAVRGYNEHKEVQGNLSQVRLSQQISGNESLERTHGALTSKDLWVLSNSSTKVRYWIPRLGTLGYSNLWVKQKENYDDSLHRTYFAKLWPPIMWRICSLRVFIILGERKAAHGQRNLFCLLFHYINGLL